MKHILTLAIFLFAFNVEGQVLTSVKAGVTMSKLIYDLPEGELTVDQVLGGQVGVNLEIPLINKGYFLTGLEYKMKGEKVSGVSIGENIVDLNTILHYLDVPLQYQHYIMEDQEGLFVNGGIGIGYYLGRTFSEDVNALEDPFRVIEFYGSVGAGYKMGKYGVGVHYQTSLLNMNANSDTPYPEGLSVKNANIGAFVRYYFGQENSEEEEPVQLEMGL